MLDFPANADVLSSSFLWTWSESSFFIEDAKEPTLCGVCGRDEVHHQPCRSFQASEDDDFACVVCGLHEEVRYN